MAIAKLRVNPASTDFEIELPDGSGSSGDYNPGEGAVLIAEDGKAYYVTFDEFDEPPLKPNALYELVAVDVVVERDAEIEEGEDDEEGEEEGEIEDEDEED